MHILLIDDEVAEREIIKHHLFSKFGPTLIFQEAATGKEGLHFASKDTFECILVDYRLPDITGLEFIKEVSISPKCPIIMLTGYGSDSIDLKAMELGVADYIPKDEMTPTLLERSIRYAIERYKTLAKLNQALASKDQFLHHVSHHFKTPLNGIIGLASNLSQGVYGEVTPLQLNALEKIRGSAWEINIMVNNVLVLLSATHSSPLMLEKIDMTECLESVLTDFAWSIQHKHLIVEKEIGHASHPLIADRDIISKVLTNLISNAIKFTKKGKITIGLNPTDTGVEIKIGDGGGGLPTKVIETLARIEENKVTPEVGISTEEINEGMGLGLLVVQHLVNRHGGKIRFVRKEEGTMTVVEIPAPGAKE